MSIEIEKQDQAIEDGKKLFSQPIEFVKGVVSIDGLPAPELAEIAFAGRSNVGKSSLINALTGRKNLARTSNTPGRTREINYFSLGEQAYLVDMPGYGYAKAPKDMVDGWTRLIEAYLRGRVSLKRAFLLIDSRHGIKKNDKDVMAKLDSSACLYQIVLTKADKIKRHELDNLLQETKKTIQKHAAAYPEILITSAQKKMGIENLRAAIFTAITS